MGIRSGAGAVEIGYLFPSGDAADVASCAAGLGNQWLVLLKDTALVSLISVNDLMLQTKSIATRTQEPFTWYIVAAVIYLVITLLSQYILKRIDLRATRFERRPS